MKKIKITLPGTEPLTRVGASEIVREAGRFESRIMLAHGQRIVNVKSMLGLLSFSGDDERTAELVAEGPDEETAAVAVAALLSASDR